MKKNIYSLKNKQEKQSKMAEGLKSIFTKFHIRCLKFVVFVMLVAMLTDAPKSEASVLGVKHHPTFSLEDHGPFIDVHPPRWYWLSWLMVPSYYDHPQLRDNCSEGANSFPDDLFTPEQLRQGAIVLHFLGGMYSFTLLAVVCNDYFIPAVECICDDLHLTKDVAAATFMAVATSSPELFVNIMSTFITESDLGIGTIVGSALFNMLGVGAIGGLAAIHPIRIKRGPVTRDSIIYMINVAVLVTMIWDNCIEWWEATILLCMYVIYFVFMFNHKRIANGVVRLFTRCKSEEEEIDDKKKELEDEFVIQSPFSARVSIALSHMEAHQFSFTEKVRKSLWRFPSEKSRGLQFWFVYTWPIKLILTCTIPSPKTFRKLYPVTFIMCIVWIGVNSYFVSWMITTIGSTFFIPDSIMGMTFLAFGGCLPEACSIFIMSRRGEGGMGISNSLGANSLAILFSLGVPWFIKTMILRGQGLDDCIPVAAGGMEYIILFLIVACCVLYIVLTVGKFMLNKITGSTIFAFYLVFIVLAILMESGVFFEIEKEC